MYPSKVELYAAIRRDARAGMSGRAIEKKYRVGRRTIVKALASAWPEPRKKLPPRASKLDPFTPFIDEMLRADLDAPRKQRHTVTRIWHRLMDEHGMADVSYPVVRAYVAERKPQVRVEAGRGAAEVFVPQTHRPGDEAEVDFGEVVVRLAGLTPAAPTPPAVTSHEQNHRSYGPSGGQVVQVGSGAGGRGQQGLGGRAEHSPAAGGRRTAVAPAPRASPRRRSGRRSRYGVRTTRARALCRTPGMRCRCGRQARARRRCRRSRSARGSGRRARNGVRTPRSCGRACRAGSPNQWFSTAAM